MVETSGLYRGNFDNFGLEVVCLRIGSFAERPRSERELAMWLSPRDAVQLVSKALTAPDVGFLVVYGASGTDHFYWENPGAAVLGNAPDDKSDDYAQEVSAQGRRSHGWPLARSPGGWIHGD